MRILQVLRNYKGMLMSFRITCAMLCGLTPVVALMSWYMIVETPMSKWAFVP